jgi:hypothetical protein
MHLVKGQQLLHLAFPAVIVCAGIDHQESSACCVKSVHPHQNVLRRFLLVVLRLSLAYRCSALTGHEFHESLQCDDDAETCREIAIA